MKGRETHSESGKEFKRLLTEVIESNDQRLEYFRGVNYVDVTPEYIRNIVEKGERELKKERKRRFLSVAVVIIVVLFSSSAMVMLMPGKEADAVRHRLQQQIMGWGDLMKDTERTPSEQDAEMGGVSKVVDKWEDVEGAKSFLPELYIPEYVPEGYQFETLTVQRTNSVKYSSVFLFKDKEGKAILVIQRTKDQEESQVLVSNATSSFETAQGTVYITKDEFTNRLSGVLVDGNNLINITAELPLEEFQKIFENL